MDYSINQRAFWVSQAVMIDRKVCIQVFCRFLGKNDAPLLPALSMDQDRWGVASGHDVTEPDADEFLDADRRIVKQDQNEPVTVPFPGMGRAVQKYCKVSRFDNRTLYFWDRRRRDPFRSQIHRNN